MTARSKTPIRRQYGDRALNSAQDNALEAHRTVNVVPMTRRDGVTVNVTLAAGKETRVPHGLGRKPTVVENMYPTKAAARFYITAADEASVTLFQENGFVDPTVSLWIC
jgi:hypothetical protein